MTLSARVSNNIFALSVGAIGYAISYGLAYLEILSHERMLMAMCALNAIMVLELLGKYKSFNLKSTMLATLLALAQMTVYTVFIGS
ncbi:hypothetical protein [Comamonas thiooxydans]|uniref:hypothetical protein n=1 Tax=Comamonas thiooxydans TaxID=363952 RepID=UPI000B40EC2A|nr:hypothetical protein [Comamonas thiooxydans]